MDTGMVLFFVGWRFCRRGFTFFSGSLCFYGGLKEGRWGREGLSFCPITLFRWVGWLGVGVGWVGGGLFFIKTLVVTSLSVVTRGGGNNVGRAVLRRVRGDRANNIAGGTLFGTVTNGGVSSLIGGRTGRTPMSARFDVRAPSRDVRGRGDSNHY